MIGKLLKRIIPAILFILIIFSWVNVLSDSPGPSAGLTNAPGESNCTSCHSGTLYTGTFPSSWTATTIPGDYIPDSIYNLSVQFYRGFYGQTFGFQITALYKDGANYRSAGEFIITDSSRTGKSTKSFNGISREYVSQTDADSKYFKFNWKAPSNNIGNITFYFTLLRSNGAGTQNFDTTWAYTRTISPSNKLPYAEIIAPTSPSVSICAGDSVSFEGVGYNNPTEYLWTVSGPIKDTSKLQNPTFRFEKSGNYTVKLVVLNKYGKSLEVKRTIVARTLPSEFITSSTNTLCDSDSIKLTAPIGSTYLWNTGQTTQDIYVKNTGEFSVTVTSSYGCVRTTQPYKIVRPQKPVLKLQIKYGADTICSSDSVMFEVNTDTNIAYYNFIDNGFSVQNSGTNIFTGKNLRVGNHTFYVMAGMKGGCLLDTSNKINIVVESKISPPTPSVYSITSSAVTIFWNRVNGASGYEISTDSQKTWTKTVDTFFTKTGLKESESLALYVRTISYSKCRYSNISELTAKTLACKNMTFNMAYDSVICAGRTATINFSNFSTNKFAIKLNGGSPTQVRTYNISTYTDTILAFTIYDTTETNCTQIKKQIKIKTIKPAAVDILTSDENCKGDVILLNATSGLANYMFYKNSTLLQNSTSNSYSGKGFLNGDTVYVLAKTKEGCISKSEGKIINILDRTTPGFIYNANNLEVQFNDTTANVTNRLWSFGDSTFSTEVSPLHKYKNTGFYTVKLITFNENCKDSVENQIKVISTGINYNPEFKNLKIYPSPFKNTITINIDARTASKAQVILSDLAGQLIINKSVQIYSGDNSFSLSTELLKPGTYILRIVTDNTCLVEKLEKF